MPTSIPAYFFAPVAVETLGVIGPDSHTFLRDLGGRVRGATREPLAHWYMLQHLSVTVQWGNALAIGAQPSKSPAMSSLVFDLQDRVSRFLDVVPSII